MKKMNSKVLFITQGAVIAALYVVLTHVANAMGLASGAVQIRLSEILTVLPYFTPAAVSGLFIGCITANLTTGCAPWDIVFGSFATLLGAVGTYMLRKAPFWTAPLPPIAANTIIVPFVIANVYGDTHTIPYLMATVGAGEVIACGVLGTILVLSLKKHGNAIRWANYKRT